MRERPDLPPHSELSPETRRSVIESFALREGTDYGEREVEIVFDPNTESIDIVVRRGAR